MTIKEQELASLEDKYIAVHRQEMLSAIDMKIARTHV